MTRLIFKCDNGNPLLTVWGAGLEDATCYTLSRIFILARSKDKAVFSNHVK